MFTDNIFSDTVIANWYKAAKNGRLFVTEVALGETFFATESEGEICSVAPWQVVSIKLSEEKPTEYVLRKKDKSGAYTMSYVTHTYESLANTFFMLEEEAKRNSEKWPEAIGIKRNTPFWFHDSSDIFIGAYVVTPRGKILRCERTGERKIASDSLQEALRNCKNPNQIKSIPEDSDFFDGA